MASEEYQVRWRGRVLGRWPKDRVVSMLYSGQISKHHEVSMDGAGWCSIKSHPDFVDLFVASLPPDEGVMQGVSDYSNVMHKMEEPSPPMAGPKATPSPKKKLTLKSSELPRKEYFQAGEQDGPVDYATSSRPDAPPLTDQNRWYYALNNQVLGPVKESDLSGYILSGAISHDTQVCKQGTDQWLPAQAALAAHFARPKAPNTYHRHPQSHQHNPRSQPSGLGWYFEPWRKFADFTGRATRREYWAFLIGNLILSVGLIILEGSLLLFPDIADYVLQWIFSLLVFIPSLAVFVRRMHDTGRSGWWWFLGLIPLIGVIVLLVFTLEGGQPGHNQYGPNPRAG